MVGGTVMRRMSRRNVSGISVVAALGSAVFLFSGVLGLLPPAPAGAADGPNGVIALGAGPPRGIWLADAEGAGYHSIIDTDPAYSFAQDFSPDGDQILYLRGGGGSQSVRVVDVDGTNDHQIVPVGPIRSADWSNDGSKVLYSTWVNGVGSSVYTIDPDGFNQVEITGLPNGFYHTLSPDGSKIAFEGIDGCWNLIVANSDGTNRESIYDGYCGADIDGLDWSPDGSKIVIAAWVPNDAQPPSWDCTWDAQVRDILLVEADGSGVTNLTNTRGVNNRTESHPAFSPDGTKIAFASQGYQTCVNGTTHWEYPSNNLYVMNADGSGEIGPLTDFGVAFQTFGIASGAGPAWQPCTPSTISCEIDLSSTTTTTGGGSSTTTTSPGDDPTTTTTLPEGPGSGSFVDDDGSVFEGDIEWLAATGITRGCNPPVNDRFCPNDPVTRGQMAAFLNRALDLDAGSDTFTDTAESVFSGDIGALAAAGITRGCNPPDNTRFCPNDIVTRGQMAAFLVRALGYTDDGGGNLFVDDNGSVFEGDIDRLGTAGVTRGCNPPVNDWFCPSDPVTRGQMAAFLRRALKG
jgi:Tol biopolymer transport system component